MAEDEIAAGSGTAVVFVYDELLCKSVSSRAEWGDLTMYLYEAFDLVDKTMLEVAHQRWAHAGITGGRGHDAKASGSGSGASPSGGRANTIAKVAAGDHHNFDNTH